MHIWQPPQEPTSMHFTRKLQCFVHLRPSPDSVLFIEQVDFGGERRIHVGCSLHHLPILEIPKNPENPKKIQPLSRSLGVCVTFGNVWHFWNFLNLMEFLESVESLEYENFWKFLNFSKIFGFLEVWILWNFWIFYNLWNWEMVGLVLKLLEFWTFWIFWNLDSCKSFIMVQILELGLV